MPYNYLPGGHTLPPPPHTLTYCRELASSAELVFMPYNYLVDAARRRGLGVAWEGAVVIFDEAHNIEVRGP